jgi:hypothetical protein
MTKEPININYKSMNGKFLLTKGIWLVSAIIPQKIFTRIFKIPQNTIN